MNIYDFFNSRDIAEHCCSIGHNLTAIETAYIIWLCDSKTIEEKHKAWQYIIDNYHDEKLPEGIWCDDNGNLIRKERSLHKFLKHYIKIENNFIESFCSADGNYIFDYGIRYTNSNDYIRDNIFYDNYKICFNDMIADMADEDVLDARITKYKLYSSPHPEIERDIHALHFNKNMEIVALDSPVLNKDWAIIDGFFSMCPDIPTPFKIGDFVTCNNINNKKNSKFVLAYLPYWKNNEKGKDMSWYIERLKNEGGDWTDMQTSIYDVDDNGNIYWNHGPNYLFLEYCRDKPEGNEKILFALGNYLQNQISLEDFMKSQAIIRAEETARVNREFFGEDKKIKQLLE